MNRWFRGVLVGSIVGIGAIVFAFSPYYQTAETRLGLNGLFHLRGPRTPPSEAVIVAIDGRSGEKLGLSDLPREWPRSTHGELIDELVRQGAAVIAFDMDFHRSREAREDAAFARAIAASNRVILVELLTGKRQPIEAPDGVERGSVWIEEVEPPLPVLADAARAQAPFPLPKLDAAVDQFWAFKSSARDSPTLPAVALQLYALKDYAQWRALLASAAPQQPELLPARADDLVSADQTRSLMLRTRELFKRNPELVHLGSSHPTGSEPAPILRALLGLYGGDDVRYLNFYGPPGTIATVPYQTVIRNARAESDSAGTDFRNKVVFVGYSDLFDPGQPDRFYTAFTRPDGVDLSGVEIAATAFANLIADDSIRPLGTGSTVGMLFLFGSIIGALVYLVPAAYGVTAALGLAAGYAFMAQWHFNHSSVWYPLATPLLLQLPLALFLGLFAQYRLERQRADHISEAIRRYVPDDVSRRLTAASADPAEINKVTYGTCLATDMAGFSTIAEKMGPSELARFLNDYFEVLATALQRHGVKVTEFRADAIMCAWTGLDNDPFVRILPVRAALDAADAIRLFNEQRGLAGRLRVGLADGEFYVGHAGGGGHFVYSIVGDCANTASRIEGLNKHLDTRILALSSVADKQDDLLLRYLGKFRFVGKISSLPITEIMTKLEDATDQQMDLCERFSQAQAAFSSADWSLAMRLFRELLSEHPQDGPARFMLARCQARLDKSGSVDEPGVIIMEAK